MDKVYSRINWENEPSVNTPLSALNLNRIDYALDEVDNRVVSIDITKANEDDALVMFNNITYDGETGKFTFTRKNGTTVVVDTLLEKVVTNFRYDYETQQLVLTTPEGEVRIDMSALITQYEFEDTSTVQLVVDSTGKVKANVIDGSITAEKLNPDYLAEITSQVNTAVESAASASADANKSKSYAVGGTGTREGEDGDNAKFYCERAEAVVGIGMATNDRLGISKPDGETVLIDETGTLHASNKISAMKDANVVSPSTDDILFYNESTQKWENRAGVVDNVVTDDSHTPLSAKAGKTLNDKISNVNVYVSEETGKLHFVDGEGADTELPFRKSNVPELYMWKAMDKQYFSNFCNFAYTIMPNNIELYTHVEAVANSGTTRRVYVNAKAVNIRKTGIYGTAYYVMFNIVTNTALTISTSGTSSLSVKVRAFKSTYSGKNGEELYDYESIQTIHNSGANLPAGLSYPAGTSIYGAILNFNEIPDFFIVEYTPTNFNLTAKIDFPSHQVDSFTLPLLGATNLETEPKKLEIKFNTAQSAVVVSDGVTEVNLETNANIKQFGLIIVGYWYIRPNVIFLMYTYQASLNTMQVVYGLFVGVDDKVWISGKRNIFPSQTIPFVSGNTDVYIGNLLPYEFTSNTAGQLGCTYMRTSLNSAGVKTNVRAYWGNYISYISTSASRIFLTTASAMTSVSAGAPSAGNHLYWTFNDYMVACLCSVTPAGVMSRKLYQFVYNNIGQPAGFRQLRPDAELSCDGYLQNDDVHCLGQLENQMYLFVTAENFEIINILSNTTANSNIIKGIAKIPISQLDAKDLNYLRYSEPIECLKLLKGSILLGVFTGNVYQIIRGRSTDRYNYSLKLIDCKPVHTNTTLDSNKQYFPEQDGQYCNMLLGIGEQWETDF